MRLLRWERRDHCLGRGGRWQQRREVGTGTGVGDNTRLRSQRLCAAAGGGAGKGDRRVPKAREKEEEEEEALSTAAAGRSLSCGSRQQRSVKFWYIRTLASMPASPALRLVCPRANRSTGYAMGRGRLTAALLYLFYVFFFSQEGACNIEKPRRL